MFLIDHVLFWPVVITLTLSLSLLLIHCKQHFSIHCYCQSSTDRQCKHCLTSKDNEKSLDFFPMSYLLYIIYLITLCIFILIINILKYVDIDEIVADHILICFFIILILWESFFNFYRFYSTYYASKKIHLLSAKMIICKFMFYAVLFGALFILQIYFKYFYYAYFALIIIHFTFNMITSWLFAYILIVQYRVVMENITYLNDLHDHMLHSIYFMRRISLISSVSSTLFVIIILNLDQFLKYSPILWGISAICISLNFSRNRQFFHGYYLKIKHKYNKHKQSPTKQTKHIKKQSNKKSVQHHDQSTQNIQIGGKSEIKIEPKSSKSITKPATIMTTIKSTLNETDHEAVISSNWYEAETSSDTIKVTTPKTNLLSDQDVDFTLDAMDVADTPKTIAKKKKAVKLLGIQSNVIMQEYKEKTRTPTTPIPGLFNDFRLNYLMKTMQKEAIEPPKVIRVSSKSSETIESIHITNGDIDPFDVINKEETTKKEKYPKIFGTNMDRQRSVTLDVSKKKKKRNTDHTHTRSLNLNVNDSIAPDLHVVELFKMLAKNGLYENANIESAEQLRKYTMT